MAPGASAERRTPNAERRMPNRRTANATLTVRGVVWRCGDRGVPDDQGGPHPGIHPCPGAGRCARRTGRAAVPLRVGLAGPHLRFRSGYRGRASPALGQSLLPRHRHAVQTPADHGRHASSPGANSPRVAIAVMAGPPRPAARWDSGPYRPMHQASGIRRYAPCAMRHTPHPNARATVAVRKQTMKAVPSGSSAPIVAHRTLRVSL